MIFVVVYKLVMCSVDTALHVYKLLWSLVLVIGTFSLFIIVLPEAVCCCVMLMLCCYLWIVCVYQV